MADIGSIALVGGNLALDFANTSGWHASEEPSEWITGYAELVTWSRHVGSLAAPAASALLRTARARPRAADRALGDVLRLREAVYRVFTALARELAPDESDVSALHVARVKALAAATPAWTEESGLVLDWPDGADLASPLHPVVLAAMELLSSPEVERLRQCGRNPCGWLFLDRSRNGTRRWCSAGECGNATRVARFRERQG